MWLDTDELMTPRHAATLAGVTPSAFQDHQRWGQIKPFVVIDGLIFYHRREVLALKTYVDTLAGRRAQKVLPKLQELF
ncbi:MAG: hypothetical protein VKN33_11130 [Candidatus Sericytochromatia bacterium]|nr:hypothetical protein [Candidatus Sericytochromatia bacterium]